MTKTSGYQCDYCNKPIDLESSKMVTRHLLQGDWLDPLFEQRELHFHPSLCHYEFHKLEEKAQRAAKKFLEEQLPCNRVTPYPR